MSKKKAVKPPPKQTVEDEFNELGGRDRTVDLEEMLCHSCGEDKSGTFEAECRVILHLEDGRILNKVFDLQFDESDIDT